MASLQPGAVFGLLRELRASATHTRPIQVNGILAEQLARELAAGGEPGAVRVGGDPAHAAALVHTLAGAPSAEDERLLRDANRARTPIVAVQTGRDATLDIPYVLATDVVACPPGAGFPVDVIAARLAARLGELGTGVAARLPVLREAVVEHLTESFARKNGILAVAIFVPGADFPILTLNQIRLVLRIAAAHGRALDLQLAPEVLAVVGGALGFRALARQLVGVIPVAGWALQGGIAYGATKAIGEAASQRFARSTRDS
jgi:uncharacterized protein (DUF697 family)